jgi:hypothetical protein
MDQRSPQTLEPDVIAGDVDVERIDAGLGVCVVDSGRESAAVLGLGEDASPFEAVSELLEAIHDRLARGYR